MPALREQRLSPNEVSEAEARYSRLEQGVAEGFSRFFVFLAGGNPVVGGDKRLTVITRAEILAFAQGNLNLLPLRLMRSWTPLAAPMAH